MYKIKEEKISENITLIERVDDVELIRAMDVLADVIIRNKELFDENIEEDIRIQTEGEQYNVKQRMLYLH